MSLTRSEMMARVRSRDTATELRIRQALWTAGFRYRLHQKDLPGTPDIVLSSRKAVIEVRGCFWHQHGCKRSSIPATRTEFWLAKLSRNVERDKQNLDSLQKMGWKVFVVWECGTKDATKVERLINRLKRLPKH